MILPLGKMYKIEAKIYTEPLLPHRLINEAVRFGMTSTVCLKAPDKKQTHNVQS